MSTPVALAHDYLTQRGGAERVVLSMMSAFPGAPLHTAFYQPDRTFPEFAGQDIRTLPLDRIAALRHHHRRALPLLARAFSSLDVEAEVVVCSSSGWAHGVHTSGRKIVYCHAPARWLYQTDRYLRESPRHARAALTVLAPSLRRWDQRAARTADRYLTTSRMVHRHILDVYGIDSTVLPPPHTLDATGHQQEIPEIEPGYLLCVSRLQTYKNVDAVLGAFTLGQLRDQRLVVVGDGPDRPRLTSLANGNSLFLHGVNDNQLRWLYANSVGLVAASHEDFGLTPLEAAAFGKPAAVLRWGGYLDTVIEGSTGLFFDEPRDELVASAVERLLSRSWDPAAMRRQAERFSEETFRDKLQSVVAQEAATPLAS